MTIKAGSESRSYDATKPLIVNANQLRWLAEQADGMRGKQLAVIVDNGELQAVPVSEVGERRQIKEFGVETPLSGEGIKGNAKIEILYNGKHHDVSDADSVFWTQSAVEKFVLPYYTRFKTPSEIDELRESLYKRGVVAALHIPPSVTLGFPFKRVRPLHQDEATGELSLGEAV